jgi:hypothetical protein
MTKGDNTETTDDILYLIAHVFKIDWKKRSESDRGVACTLQFWTNAMN